MKNISVLVFILGVCVFSSLTARSQSAILNKEDTLIVRGVVIDNEGGLVDGATLTFYGNQYLHTKSNKNGQYKILLTPQFRSNRTSWEVYVYCKGFRPNRTRVYLENAKVESVNGKRIYYVEMEMEMEIYLNLLNENPHETIISR